jgi:VanZ family protein
MSSRRCGIKYWLGVWLPVIVGLSLIAMESTEAFGSDHTSGPMRLLFQAIFGHVSDVKWEMLHHIIRKSGHFTGYGLLSLTWLRAWWYTLPYSRYFKDAVLALLATGMTASADEFHQSFLPNRTSSVWDVLLDCCGAIAIMLVFYVIVRLFHPRRLAWAK